MKRKWMLLTTAIILTSLLAGCGLLSGNYVSIEPHIEENVHPDAGIVSVYSYDQLRRTLVSLVEDGIQRKVISVATINPSYVHSYMDAAIYYVTKNCAIGAYFVDTIRYELGTNAGQPAIAVDITYRQGQTDILRLNRVTDMDGAAAVITAALDDCATGAVFLVENYEEIDLSALILERAHIYPQRIVEIPGVSVLTYPEFGAERIVELSFTYKSELAELLSMQDLVRTMFTSAQLYLEDATSDSEKFSQLYSFLMERYNYRIERTDTPAYSLLYKGRGDEEAFACVYAAMCRYAGLDCRMITGTKDGNPWVWNVLSVDGVDYYIDLLECYQGNGFYMMRQSEMDAYTWNPNA